MEMGEPNELSQTHLTDPNFGKPPQKQNPINVRLGEPHVSSFNYMLDDGLNLAIDNLNPVEFMLKDGTKVRLTIDDAKIHPPQVPSNTVGVKEPKIFPAECRQRAGTYKGKLVATVGWSVDGKQHTLLKDFGDIPIMVKSKMCNLENLNPEELVKRGEHEQEWGGYFIVKGHERLIRMLLTLRRNYPVAIKRNTWKKRGDLFSEFGIQIRCVREDQTETNNVLHYLTDGTAKLMFSYRSTPFYVPVMLLLKCLYGLTDKQTYIRLTQGYKDECYFDCLLGMQRSLSEQGLINQAQCKKYLGRMFRAKLTECPPWYTDEQVADFLIKKCILIHLDSNKDKFMLLTFMMQKLFAFYDGKLSVEGADSVMVQEVIMGGHLYLQVLKEKLQNWLGFLKFLVTKRDPSSAAEITPQLMTTAVKRAEGMSQHLEHFLATGNLPNNTSINIMQDKGLTILAENINRMRYMSHFRAVHRGSFFQEMRTTEVRKLLPEAWGFICPVHTPDGAPCGLLNHLTLDCIITDIPDKNLVKGLPSLLVTYGMAPLDGFIQYDSTTSYPVLLDGQLMGRLLFKKGKRFTETLRQLKIVGKEVPKTLEIVLVPEQENTPQFPGIYLFSGPARMMRPVLHLAMNQTEYIGTFEQVYLDVALTEEQARNGVYTHMELNQRTSLSNLAQLIPLPDCNQSPRNMYQCQMGKQTMGTPCHNWRLQGETKSYRLLTPQSPLFRTKHYDDLQLDEFAMGTNAIIAVLPYTGYEMEDAIVINKFSAERGFGFSVIYKTEFYELDNPTSYFGRDPHKPALVPFLDVDGLPFVGRRMECDEPLYCYYDRDEGKYIVKNYTYKEVCYVDTVKLCGNPEKSNKAASIIFRTPRDISVGDKFASRAGQKGICARKVPMVDLPFSESGMVPDIIFNPHGFPSRMTVAMMIEIMAGKSAAMHGLAHDATPFVFNEEDTAVHYFGRLLEMAGYNYHGLETMYSGITGEEMEVGIFMGVVYYQRLRHMVSDKWQVRSTGPIDTITRQPLKGRKRGGGVRFGEMERDSLISHGCSSLLRDRLFSCSDAQMMFICTKCKSIMSPVSELVKITSRSNIVETKNTCKFCKDDKHIKKIELPYTFKLLASELLAYNIHLDIDSL